MKRLVSALEALTQRALQLLEVLPGPGCAQGSTILGRAEVSFEAPYRAPEWWGSSNRVLVPRQGLNQTAQVGEPPVSVRSVGRLSDRRGMAGEEDA